jgi:hypothetical protein
MTVEEWVNERLGGYVKLAVPERHDAVIELKAEGHSNRDIASILGVGETSVRRATAPNGAPESEFPNETPVFDAGAAPNGAPESGPGECGSLARRREPWRPSSLRKCRGRGRHQRRRYLEVEQASRTIGQNGHPARVNRSAVIGWRMAPLPGVMPPGKQEVDGSTPTRAPDEPLADCASNQPGTTATSRRTTA